jgi:hypothetical protein
MSDLWDKRISEDAKNTTEKCNIAKLISGYEKVENYRPPNFFTDSYDPYDQEKYKSRNGKCLYCFSLLEKIKASSTSFGSCDSYPALWGNRHITVIHFCLQCGYQFRDVKNKADWLSCGPDWNNPKSFYNLGPDRIKELEENLEKFEKFLLLEQLHKRGYYSAIS